MLVVNVVKVYGGTGGAVEVVHGGSDSKLDVAVMVTGAVAVETAMVEVEKDGEDEGEAGRVDAEVEVRLVMGDVGVATGGGESVLVAVAVAEVTSSLTVWVLMMVIGAGVVSAGWMETTEMLVSVAMIVSVVAPAEAVTVSVFGDEVTVWVTVVAEGVGEEPPSMGTTEYRGRRA